MKPHSVSAFSAFDAVTSDNSMAKVTGLSACGGAPPWMCQTGLASRCLRVLPRIGLEKLLIFVDVARDDVEIEPLRRLRLAIHEQRQALGAGVTQPLVDGEPVALRLGDFLALLVEEKLVIETLRRQCRRARGRFRRRA